MPPLDPLFGELALQVEDLFGRLGMGLAQLVRLLVERLDLVAQGGQVALHALVLPLEGLDGAQIAAKVLRVKGLVLLLDPVLGLVHVSVEALHLVRRPQLLLALVGL